MEHCIESAYDSLVEKFEALIAGFNEKDQEIAKQWLEKLKNTQGDTKELKLRNEILGYFLQCSEVGKFGAEPFNVIPPKDETLYKQRWMLVCTILVIMLKFI